MDRLFGVTMAERGVSQIVSVDLKKAEEIVKSANINYIANKCIKQEYQKFFLKMSPVFPALKNS